MSGVTTFYYRDRAAPTVNRPLRLGVVAIIEHDGALLVERRSDTGTWGLLGGGLEANETLVEAVAREVREESGLEVRSTEFFGTFSDPTRIVSYPEGSVSRVVTIAYLASVEGVSGLRLSHESTELAFVPHDRLDSLTLVPTHAHIVRAYLDTPGVPRLE
jgi:ADP-ribose pyrophosphatase YjhB (NUDIX family)